MLEQFNKEKTAHIYEWKGSICPVQAGEICSSGCINSTKSSTYIKYIRSQGRQLERTALRAMVCKDAGMNLWAAFSRVAVVSLMEGRM